MTFALIAGAFFTLPALGAEETAQPVTAAPAGWTALSKSGSQYFFPPGASNDEVYEAVFPMLTLDGTFDRTVSEIWHKLIGNERLVDAKTKTVTAQDGTPADEVLVATLNAQNRGVYRVFVVKQYGNTVAAGELRFNDVDRIKAIGEPAVASLLGMRAPQSVQPQSVQPYHAREVKPMRSAGIDAAPQQGSIPAGLAGTWALKVPGVAYQTSVDYGAYTQRTLHVSAGGAAGYLRISSNKSYVWYDGSGHAVSHGSLLQVIPHNFSDPKKTYWRVYEGREAHYLCLDGDGGISLYDPGTNMVSMEGSKH